MKSTIYLLWDILSHFSEEISFLKQPILKQITYNPELNKISLLSDVVDITLANMDAIEYLKNHSKEERKLMPVDRSG